MGVKSAFGLCDGATEDWEKSPSSYLGLNFLLVGVREGEVHNLYSPNFLHIVICVDNNLSHLHLNGELTIVQDSSLFSLAFSERLCLEAPAPRDSPSLHPLCC